MSQEKKVELEPFLRQTQMIVGGLVSGIVIFLVIVLIQGGGLQPLDQGAVISIAMAVMSLGSIGAWFVVPGLVADSNLQKIAQGNWHAPRRGSSMQLPDTDEGRLLSVFLTRLIIGDALLEGGAFANLVAFMLEGQSYSIVLAALLLLGIVVSFPTHTRLTEWLETQTQRLRESKNMR